MLGLSTHEPHFSLLREEVKFGKSAKRLVFIQFIPYITMGYAKGWKNGLSVLSLTCNDSHFCPPFSQQNQQTREDHFSSFTFVPLSRVYWLGICSIESKGIVFSCSSYNVVLDFTLHSSTAPSQYLHSITFYSRPLYCSCHIRCAVIYGSLLAVFQLGLLSAALLGPAFVPPRLGRSAGSLSWVSGS